MGKPFGKAQPFRTSRGTAANSNLLRNMSYIYGCDFGISVFERIETNDFNPNIAFETGFMFALGKDVCLLKDKTLQSLLTDIVGILDRPFDTRNVDATISQELSKWMKDKEIISKIYKNQHFNF